jgi:hypothetical protein
MRRGFQTHVDGGYGALYFGGLSRGEFAATFSANPLLTSVIAEHIHIDIYLLGLRRKQGIREIPEELMLQSLLEKENRL